MEVATSCRQFVTSSKDGDARRDVTLKKYIICLSGHTLVVTCVKWGGDGWNYIYTGVRFTTLHGVELMWLLKHLGRNCSLMQTKRKLRFSCSLVKLQVALLLSSLVNW